MKKGIIIFTTLALILLVTLAVTSKKPDQGPTGSETKEETLKKQLGIRGPVTPPKIDFTDCTLQANGAYICPASTLKKFGPIIVTDTASKRTCTVSYDSAQGFTFTGQKYKATVPPGALAVAMNERKNASNIVRSDVLSLSMHLGDNGEVDHVLFVNNNYTTEQCLSVQ